MRFGNVKKFIIIIIIILLPIRVLPAQDFSIEAETLVFNRASNIFSAKGDVKIFFADVRMIFPVSKWYFRFIQPPCFIFQRASKFVCVLQYEEWLKVLL